MAATMPPPPGDPHGWCAPHLVSLQWEPATTSVNGTSVCTAHAVATLTAASGTSGGTSGLGIVIRL